MSEERDVVRHELLGDEETKNCALCGLPRPKSTLILVSGESIGLVGGDNVDVCVDCYQGIQRGDVEPIGDPDF